MHAIAIYSFQLMKFQNSKNLKEMQSGSRMVRFYRALFTLNARLESPQQSQLYCTAAAAAFTDDSILTPHIDSSSKKQTKKRGKNKDTLYSKISPLGNPSINVAPLIDQWVESGKQVRFAELQRITRDLRKRSRFSQALQVSEWMKNNEAFTFSPTQHAVQIDLIGKVHGYLAAESYFNNLSEVDKTEKTYGALLHCYVRQRDLVKALSHLQSMTEKGLLLTALTFNDIMSLYTKTGKYEKIPDTLSVMKEAGVSPDNMSYKICLNSYGQRSDIKGMEILLDEMDHLPDISVDWSTCVLIANFYIKEGLKEKANDFLKRAEERLQIGDAVGYNHLISLHASLGNKSEVFRLWSLEKNTCKKCLNKDYLNIVNNLVRINELEEAEKVLEEWESSGNHYDLRIPYIIIDKYIEKGQYIKAETMLEDLMDKGKMPTPHRWGRVVVGHLELGNTVRAVEGMKVAISLGKQNAWKPDADVLNRLLDVLGVEASTSDVDTLVEKFLNITSEERANTSSPT